jgi:hypothetical protein
MTARNCTSPIAPATLLEYWLGELDEAREGQLDEHLLGCGHCSANLQSLLDLAGEVRRAVRTGAVPTVLTAAFVRRFEAEGLRLREYRVPHNGSVYCTVAPDDDLLITRLDAPLAGIERLDLERLHDVPFDTAAGEVVITPRMADIRALPATTLRMRLLAVAPAEERLVGEYTFHHSPHRPGEKR